MNKYEQLSPEVYEFVRDLFEDNDAEKGIAGSIALKMQEYFEQLVSEVV